MANKLDLQRTYVYGGKDYGPGPTEIEDKAAYEAIQQREKEYADHLKRGGAPIAPVTATLSPATGQVLNRTSLNTPPAEAATATTQIAEDGGDGNKGKSNETKK